MENEDQLLCIETIRKCLLELKITLKRTSMILYRVYIAQRLNERRTYAREFLRDETLDERSNIFVDESGFNLHLIRRYGRSTPGELVTVTVPTVRSTNITLLCAINGEQIIHYKLFSGSCNSVRFKEFLSELDIILSSSRIVNPVIIFDNARAHTCNETRAHFSSLNSRVKFLPTYSYMLNPIECSFSKIKSFVRTMETTGQNIYEIITADIESITRDDTRGWYRLMRRNIGLSIDNHVFQ